MNFIDEIYANVRSLNQKEGLKKILLVDGDDQRAIETAKMLKKDNFCEPILLVKKPQDVVEGIETIVMDETEIAKYAQKFFELRKGKETEDAALKAMQTRPFFAMMKLRNNEVDGVVGGLLYTTADILRAGFKVIGPKPGIKTISSANIMHKGSEKYIFSDISVNVKPNPQQLAEIGLNAVEFARKTLNLEPNVAFLSFSTDGSAVTDESKATREAADIFNQLSNSKNPAIGEIQFDAAIDTGVRSSKYKRPAYDGATNIFVFPSLEAGNIGYKIAQRMGNWGAIGPIINGIAKPLNDLSRGATVDDVFNTVLITVLQTAGGND
ncbi:phosphate acetyltransferase [Candidatus Mycoplasma pogonae]